MDARSSARLPGIVVSIHLAAAAGDPPLAVDSAQAVPGRGLAGDRYFLETGFYSDRPDADRELTLIELEVIEALRREHGIALGPGEARRNLVTCGIPLNNLVGRDFHVGRARCRGLRLCEPCLHLAEVTGQEVLAPLVHRGGSRAQILTGEAIRAGDALMPAGESSGDSP